MIDLAGYETLVQIHDSINSQVYRARRVKDCQPVILKVLNRDYPSPKQIRRYKQEYHLICQLDAPGIIKAYNFEEWQRSYVIILEDFGGISLAQWLQEREKLPLEEFLKIAIATTESVAQIHAQNIIHKDINSANIVVNPETQELKIIDFGISTQLNRENPTLKNPNVLEGTLAYISPEQTGRMNRGLDYRTDFYSLGITFYELLTGKLPFSTEDPLELVHYHIAKIPRSPVEIEESIPAIISQIIMKLMAKNAEDRYQSAYGLKVDLETCQQQLEKRGNIDFFALGRQDISDRFQIPQKLYGREAEIARLLAAFVRVASPEEKHITETGNVELMLVSGYSGIGKSALVQELYKPITARRGYFISGKFDQFQRNVPYSAIVAAFRELIAQLLGESQRQLQIWRDKLLQALGNNGQIIIDVIPEVELIIGKQSPVPILGAKESQSRFNLAIGNFIHVFCEREHPLTLFLDDLQWADLGTLKLLERLLIEGKTQHLLLLGAYRNNEVSLSHPLAISLVKIQEKNPHAISKIVLTPLPEEQIANLISDTLQKTPENVRDLAHLILQKTQGNPFFVNEFLQALYRENLLIFHSQLKCWQWNMGAIEARDFTDNVVDLMVEKLKELPTPSQEILSFAACWGVEFDLTLMTWVGKKSPQDTFQLLKEAINLGLILPLSEPDENLLIHFYKFGHDRIQQAAYSLVPEHLKESTHTTIGKLVLANTTITEQEDKIFDIVSQMNHSISSPLKSGEEKEELIALNVKAGQKAQDSTAYDVANYHFNIGIQLLSKNCWQDRYELTLFLYNKIAEVTGINGEFEAMEIACQEILENAQSILDKINVYEIKIRSAIAQNQALVAVNTALKVVNKLGEQMSLHPEKSESERIINKAKQAVTNAVKNKDIACLVDLPINQNPHKLAIAKILMNVHSATFFVAPQLSPIEICIRTTLCMQYGNSEESAHIYADYGLLLCGLFDEIEMGYAFGKLALAIAEKFPLSGIQARGKIVTYYAVIHWKESFRNILIPLKIAAREAIESGDWEYAGYGLLFYCAASFLAGLELPELVREVAYQSQIIAQTHQKASHSWSRIYYQTILNLTEHIEQPWLLLGQSYNENEEILRHYHEGDFFGLFLAQTNKLIIAYLFENYELAREYADIAKKYAANVTGHLVQPCFFIYDSLLQLEYYANAREQDRQVLLDRVNENQARLKLWRHHCPANYLHKYHLVEAQKCRVLGQYLEAIEFYDRAIAEAKENKYLQEEALANELAAKFYLDWGKEKFARLYMIEAHYCYQCWGAIGKVKHLEQEYPHLLLRTPANQQTTSSTLHPTRTTMQASSTSTEGENLDIASVFKATRAISSEIVLDRLLSALMEILVENAGAQRGILLLADEEHLTIAAIKEIDAEKAIVLPTISLEEFPAIPIGIVRYVARTREALFLDNAIEKNPFAGDPYIQQNQCHSLACVPFINQGQLQGIAYLENNLAISAFTKKQVESVQILAGQAAIAISNAQLYGQLKDNEKQLKQFLDAVPFGIGIIDAKGHPYYTNRKARELLGKEAIAETKSDEIADTYQIYLAQSDRLCPPEQSPLLRALKGESSNANNIEIRRSDRVIPIESWGTPVYNERGEIVYAISAFQDITEQKKAEKLLIDYNQSLEKQLALSLENTQLYEASKRFVPEQFLSFLEKESIIDVKLGDQIEREMTVLFSDIRDFTTISEQMTPAENFAFINGYLGRMEPLIQQYGGFIDKYIGDAIMALFGNTSDDALQAAIAMLEELKIYNSSRIKADRVPLRIGIGLHTGRLMLGTVGGADRMDGTAIGDSVNLSSRVEGLTKTYGISLLITERTFVRLKNPSQYDFRFIERVTAKGKAKAVSLFEVFSADSPDLREAKNASKKAFEEGAILFHQRAFTEAAKLFQQCLEYHQDDRAARGYLERCSQ